MHPILDHIYGKKNFRRIIINTDVVSTKKIYNFRNGLLGTVQTSEEKKKNYIRSIPKHIEQSRL